MSGLGSFLSLLTNSSESVRVALSARTIVESYVDDFGFPASVVVPLQHFGVGNTQDWVVQPQSVSLVAIRLQNVGFGPDWALKSHDDAFTVEYFRDFHL